MIGDLNYEGGWFFNLQHYISEMLRDRAQLITTRTSHSGFRVEQDSMTLNDFERLKLPISDMG